MSPLRNVRMDMKTIQRFPVRQMKLMGLAIAIAAISYQPAMSAKNQLTSMTAVAQSPIDAQMNGLAHEFIGVAHSTSGTAQIVEENGQRYLEFDSAFRSGAGPDLFVLLHAQPVPRSYSPNEYVNLGPLQQVAGAQRYAIPADVALDSFKSAVIWCRQFDVTFGYATL